MSTKTDEPDRALTAKQRVEAGLGTLRVGLASYAAKDMRDRRSPNRLYDSY